MFSIERKTFFFVRLSCHTFRCLFSRINLYKQKEKHDIYDRKLYQEQTKMCHGQIDYTKEKLVNFMLNL